ncbi:hypothetical protein EKG40_08295 [Pseudomonas moorei]|nr:hypothetical protein EKG40_08295 [Pseudomonas moorei]
MNKDSAEALVCALLGQLSRGQVTEATKFFDENLDETQQDALIEEALSFFELSNWPSIFNGGGNRVMCQLPNQGCIALLERTVSCPNGHRYCKRHRLIRCPECGVHLDY